MIQEIGEEIHWCPSTSGFKSWRAMSYNPDTEAFYIPLNLNCETGTFGPVEKREGGGGVGPVRRTNHFHPDSPDHIGEFVAMSVRTGEVLWRHRTRTPMNTAALTTDGGIAVAGDWDRYVFVYDARTGAVPVADAAAHLGRRASRSATRRAASSTSPCRPAWAGRAGTTCCRTN